MVCLKIGDYSRENKDKIRFRLKNEYKPEPARWDFDLKYARYDHVLTRTDTPLQLKRLMIHFIHLNGVVGMEYIWVSLKQKPV